MNYSEIVTRNRAMMSAGYEWWPAFIYHFTDIQNAVSILKDGRILCRADAEGQHKMCNENASKAVIDMTDPDVTAYARFYFRPKTPTQYHNEGYKHPNARRFIEGANIPVPIFFLFDTIEMLNTDGVVFSTESQAGHGTDWHAGPDNFGKLAFSEIYNDGPMQNIEHEKKVRQAEIAYHGSFEIKNRLKFILCRSEPERITLLSLLESESIDLLRKYQGIIKTNTTKMFYKNGQYVKDVLMDNDNLIYRLNDSPYLHSYAKKYCENEILPHLEIPIAIKLTWLKEGKVIDGRVLTCNINFFSNQVSVRGVKNPAADKIHTEFIIDKSCIMSISEFLNNISII